MLKEIYYYFFPSKDPFLIYLKEIDKEHEMMRKHLDNRIRQLYTPEEWKAVEDRCNKILNEGYIRFE